MRDDYVVSGRFCRIGDRGRTKLGTIMDCMPTDDEKRGRWRLAAGEVAVSKNRPRKRPTPLVRDARRLRGSELNHLRKTAGLPYDGPLPRRTSQIEKMQHFGFLDSDGDITDSGREAIKVRDPNVGKAVPTAAAAVKPETPPEDRSADAGTDWSKYKACSTCGTGPGEPCIDLQTHALNATPHPGRPTAATAAKPLPDRIGEAYDELAKRPGGPVALADLRDKLPDVPRDELDKALLDMDDKRAIQLEPDPDRAGLTDRDRESALDTVGTDKHLLRKVDRGEEPPPAPAREQVDKDVLDAVRRLSGDDPDGNYPVYVSLRRLRADLADRYDQEQVDTALRSLQNSGRLDLEPEANQKILTGDDRGAAVHVGSEDRHLAAYVPPLYRGTYDYRRVARAGVDRSRDAGTDWSRYGACGACGAPAEGACLDLSAEGGLNSVPHPGRTLVGRPVNEYDQPPTLQEIADPYEVARRAAISADARRAEALREATTHQPWNACPLGLWHTGPCPAKEPATDGRPDPAKVRADLAAMTDASDADRYVADLDLSKKDMKALADGLGITVPSNASKDDMARQIVRWTVGRRLASQAIARPNLRDVGPAAPAEDRSARAGTGWSAEEARAAYDQAAGLSEARLRALPDAVVNAAVHHPSESYSRDAIVDEAVRRATPVDPAADVVAGHRSAAPELPNGWGTGAGNVCFHDHGATGRGLQEMGSGRFVDVDGEPLANHAGRIATRVVRGQITPDEGFQEMRKLRDRTPDGSAARRGMDAIVESMGCPQTPPPPVPDAVPEPVRNLVRDLHEQFPIVRRDGRETRKLVDICNDWLAGDRRSVGLGLGQRLNTEVRGAHHESDGDRGALAIAKRVTRCVKELEELRRADRMSLYPPRAS